MGSLKENNCPRARARVYTARACRRSCLVEWTASYAPNSPAGTGDAFDCIARLPEALDVAVDGAKADPHRGGELGGGVAVPESMVDVHASLYRGGRTDFVLLQEKITSLDLSGL